MKSFEMIKSDQQLIDFYGAISEFEDLEKGWAHHNWDHVNHVAHLVEVVLKALNYEEDFIEDVKIAALLHDVGAIKGKEGHALRSYEFAKAYLEEQNINLKNRDLVLEAIKIHSDGFQSNSVMALTLILCDKLDIKHTRVAKAGYNVVGMRQLQYIKDISIAIQNQQLKINFLCDDQIDIPELEAFYFIHKVFSGIIAFSKKLDLYPKVFLNNKEWELFTIRYNE